MPLVPQTITPLKVISPRSTSKASSDGPKSAAKTPANAVKTPSTRTPNSASPAVPLSTRSRRVVEELSSIPLPEDTPSDSSARQTPQSSKGSRGSTSTTPTTSQRSKKSAKKGPQQEQRQGAGFLRKAFLLLLFLALPLVAAAFLCSGSPLLPHALVASVNPTCTQVQQVLVDARAAAFARAEQAGLKPDELLHQLSARIAPITEAAEQALGTAQAAALDAYARLAQLAAQAGISLPGAGPSGHSFEAVLSIDRMTPIISLEPRWVDSLQDMYAHASGSSSSRSVAARKAAGLALSCRHDAECAAAQAALTAAVTSAAALLHVRGREFAGSDAAGALQQALAAFFSATPNGVVLVTDLDFVTLGAVTVLNNALSEAGSLQAGGKAVPTSRGLFVLLVHVPHAVESAEDYEFTVKVGGGLGWWWVWGGGTWQALAAWDLRQVGHFCISPGSHVSGREQDQAKRPHAFAKHFPTDC